MNRKLSRSLMTVSVVGLAGLLSGGCLDETSAIFVEGILPVTAPECTANPNVTVFQAGGVLDIGRDGLNDANSYTAAASVVTNLPATFTNQQAQQSQQTQPNYPNYGNADTNVVVFDAVDVYFEQDEFQGTEALPLGGTLPGTPGNARRTSIGGTVFNTQTQLNTSAAVFIPLVTANEADLMQELDYTLNLRTNPTARARMTAKMRIVGHTLGGGQVISSWFGYPIQLCARCLTNVGWEGEFDANGVPVCPVPGQVLLPVEDNPSCFVGQDAVSSACQTP